jgi:hypothetical protein
MSPHEVYFCYFGLSSVNHEVWWFVKNTDQVKIRINQTMSAIPLKTQCFCYHSLALWSPLPSPLTPILGSLWKGAVFPFRAPFVKRALIIRKHHFGAKIWFYFSPSKRFAPIRKQSVIGAVCRAPTTKCQFLFSSHRRFDSNAEKKFKFSDTLLIFFARSIILFFARSIIKKTSVFDWKPKYLQNIEI